MSDFLACPRRFRPLAIAATALLLVVGCSDCADDDAISFDDVEDVHIESGVEFPNLVIDAERLEQERDEFYSEPDLTGVDAVADVDIDRFKDAFRTLNEAQFLDDDVPDEADIQEASAVYRHQLRMAITPLGKDAFVPLGEPLFQECNRGVEELLDAVQGGELTMMEALENPPADRFETYRRSCGNLLAYLEQRHLVDEDGRWTRDDAPELVDIRQRYRWVDEARSYYPVQKLMSPYELKVFYRWRVEDDQAYSPEARREYIRIAQTLMPDFYGPLAEARIDALDLDREQTVERFRKLAEEFSPSDDESDDAKDDTSSKAAVYEAIYAGLQSPD